MSRIVPRPYIEPARLPRSYLYVPGDDTRKLAGALNRGADALILDLEDAVAPANKDAGRAATGAFLDGLAGGMASQVLPQLWLRINPGTTGSMDIASAWRPALAGVMVAKSESMGDLERVNEALAAVEAAAGQPVGSTRVVPLLESAAAIAAATVIAVAPRVAGLHLGEVDLASGLGIDVTGAGAKVLTTIRSMVVLAAATAGLNPPAAAASTDFRNLAALRRSTADLAAMGFVGRACIHPAQIAVANEVFTPSQAAIDQARNLVKRFDAHRSAGHAVMVSDSGTMIDEAVVRRSRRLLSLTDNNEQAT